MNEEMNNNQAAVLENRQSASIKDLCFIAVFTAIICVLSQISIPMPAGVPMTLQTLIIPLSGIVIGKKKGTYSTLLYLLLGAVGIANMWYAIFADVGVMVIAVLNAIRALHVKNV